MSQASRACALKKEHPAVMLPGARKKVQEKSAALGCVAVAALLLQGGIVYVLQTMDTYAVATHVNMALINITLPIMAGAGIILQLRDLIAILRKPASEFKKADPMDVEAILEKAS